VQDHYLFAQLGEPDLSHMMEAMQRVNKGAGEGIIKQGDKGAEFYILEKGTADVSSF
jgi:signal-transduction protein with cAMP-binding, CBS, and nucleotidyltransferase domain